eukprot:gnl/MRDRNA2_/MRDRNA2_31069_c0_seq1.p1 gnl/MRDRNA2_/MRDRNA2_31069_c0~~gnl/MRDRNA2_/MRDRNA2_31069_c0_seq1.p1  ORF type:complete len:576 (+),score=97.73 gnl/MRDRNA2_/MRDRNA2_31069_c0_seq1:65-1729(+)
MSTQKTEFEKAYARQKLEIAASEASVAGYKIREAELLSQMEGLRLQLSQASAHNGKLERACVESPAEVHRSQAELDKDSQQSNTVMVRINTIMVRIVNLAGDDVAVFDVASSTKLQEMQSRLSKITCLPMYRIDLVFSHAILDLSLRIDETNIHDGSVITMVVHRPKCIITSSSDGMSKVWDRYTFECLCTLEGGRGVVKAAISKDSFAVVTISDGVAKLWDIDTGGCRFVLCSTLGKQRNSKSNQELNEEEDMLEEAREDDTNNDTSEASHEAGDLGPFRDCATTVAFSSNGNVVVVFRSHIAKLWRASTGEFICVLEGHKRCINTVEFSPDSLRVLTASEDATAKIWNANFGKCLHTLGKECLDYSHHRLGIQQALFSPDGSIVATIHDSSLRIWNPVTGEQLQNLSGGWLDTSPDVAFSKSGLLLTCGNGPVRLWNVCDGHIIRESRFARFSSQAFSSDGSLLCTFHDRYEWGKRSANFDVSVYTSESGEQTVTLKGHKDVVNMASFSFSGTDVVTASDDGTAKVWNGDSGECLYTLEGHRTPVIKALFAA